MVILGIWDGHDSGAAVLVDGRLAAAINEERLTRRKLEIAFPAASIRACLDAAGIAPGDNDRRALGPELERDFPSDAVAAAGDERGLACQLHLVIPPSG